MSKQSKKWGWKNVVQSEFKEGLIDLARVTRVVKWWRRMRFRATVAAWDWKWRVWLWVWKANEVTIAIKKAIHNAKKDLITLPIVNWTINRDVFVKFKSARVLLMPAWEGTWIIAWWSIRKIAEVVWIHNLLSKRFWTNNKLVNAQAMMKAIWVLIEANKQFKKKQTKKDIKKIEDKVIESIEASEEWDNHTKNKDNKEKNKK